MSFKKVDFSKEKIHEVIFEAETPNGKLFDVLLLITILASVIIVMLESVEALDQKYHQLFYFLEWSFTIFFTVEYALRIYCVYRPFKYVTSFFGVIDLLAILPSYLELVIQSQSAHYLATVRILRVLRIFRILKLTPYLAEANILTMALLNRETLKSFFKEHPSLFNALPAHVIFKGQNLKTALPITLFIGRGPHI